MTGNIAKGLMEGAAQVLNNLVAVHMVSFLILYIIKLIEFIAI